MAAKNAAGAVMVPLPEDVVAELGVADDDLPGEVREMLVVGLVRESRISAGRGAQLLGIGVYEFTRLLERHNVPYLNYDDEDLARESEAVEAYFREEPKGS